MSSTTFNAKEEEVDKHYFGIRICCLMDRLQSFGNDPFDKPPCKGCSSSLSEPYIKCAECGPSPFLLCLQCFTRGFEYKQHESDHKYEIMTSDFPVLEPGWTALEEMALLEAVMDCGFGNWQDVAYQMRTKTKEECESHYMKNFIHNPLFSSTLLSLGRSLLEADFLLSYTTQKHLDVH
uniref:Transcriptional adaptor 2A n=1 Tax=Gasterosteus aculeatus aculeatus TaxID=481459 RepID=A0AAQ4PXH6_GASAC